MMGNCGTGSGTPLGSGVPPRGGFADPRSLVKAWYAIGRSRWLARCKVRTVELGPLRLAIWRDEKGQAHAVDARCPHLGADLGQARVVDGCIQCIFHHWRFGDDGRCVSAPGHDDPPNRRVRSYPLAERFGLIWIFTGDRPDYALPALSAAGGRGWWTFHGPSQTIDCHPHLVIGNGLDAGHFETLHDLELKAPPRLEQGEGCVLTLHLRGRSRAPAMRWLTGTRRRDLTARFTVTGPTIALASVDAPYPFHTVFTARPDARGRAVTHVAMLLPRGMIRASRCVAGMYSLLHNDRRVLERLRFHRGFTDADESLRRFAAMVDAMEVI